MRAVGTTPTVARLPVAKTRSRAAAGLPDPVDQPREPPAPAQPAALARPTPAQAETAAATRAALTSAAATIPTEKASPANQAAAKPSGYSPPRPAQTSSHARASRTAAPGLTSSSAHPTTPSQCDTQHTVGRLQHLVILIRKHEQLALDPAAL